MPKPDTPREETIRDLAQAIERAGLRSPAVLLLDIFEPLDFLSSQFALFVKPFAAGQRWGAYADALSNETVWGDLRRLLGHQQTDTPDPPPDNRKQEI